MPAKKNASKRKVEDPEEMEVGEESETRSSKRQKSVASKDVTEASSPMKEVEKDSKKEETSSSEPQVEGEEEEEEKPKLKRALTRRRSKIPVVNPKMRDVIWSELPFVGIELDNMPDIQRGDWTFSELRRELTTGELSQVKHKLFMFKTAEPMDKNETKATGGGAVDVWNTPLVIVIDPAGLEEEVFDKIAIATIQAAETKVFSMREKKFNWTPYVPVAMKKKNLAPEKLYTNLYYLDWEEREVNSRKWGEDEKTRFAQFLPYIVLPQMFDDKGTLKERQNAIDTTSFWYKTSKECEVQKTFEVIWDKSCMVTKVDIPYMMEDNEIPEEEYPHIVAALKASFDSKREAEEKLYNSEKAILDKLTPHEQTKLRQIKCYKFYPDNNHKDSRPMKFDPTINRFYGKAEKIYPKADSNPVNDNPLTYEEAKKNPLKIGAMGVFAGWKPVGAGLDANGKPTDQSSGPANSTTSFGGFVPTSGSATKTEGTATFGWAPPPATGNATASFGWAPPAATGNAPASFGFAPSSTPVTGGFVPNFESSSAGSVSTFKLPSGDSKPIEGGFVFNPNATAPVSSAPTSGWKCAACEHVNPDTSTACSICMCNKPIPKA